MSEKALHLCNSEYIKGLIIEHYRTVEPIVIEALYQCARMHWNKYVSPSAVSDPRLRTALFRDVRHLMFDFLKLFKRLDEGFYEECVRKFKEAKVKRMERQERVANAWTCHGKWLPRSNSAEETTPALPRARARSLGSVLARRKHSTIIDIDAEKVG